MNSQNGYPGQKSFFPTWQSTGGNSGGYATPQASGTGYNSPSGIYGNADSFYQGMPDNNYQQASSMNQAGSHIPQTAWTNPAQGTVPNNFSQSWTMPQQPVYQPTANSYAQQPVYQPTANNYAQQPVYNQHSEGYQPTGYQNTQPMAYMQQGPANQPAQSKGYPAGGNGYPFQQTGYQQPGNTFQPQQQAMNYNAFAQMGRENTQAGQGYNPTQNIPLNGGGYVPPHQKTRSRPFVFDTMKLILLCVVLIALFAAGMMVPSLGILKWGFVALTAVSLVYFWIRNPIAENRRLCFTVVFGALLVVSVVSGLAAGGRVTGSSTAGQVNPQYGNETESGPLLAETVNTPFAAVSPSTPTPPPEDGPSDADTLNVLQNFFYYWGANKHEEMLNLCLPSWRSSVDSANTALFAIMANRTPLDYIMEKISGTVDDTSRTVTLTSTMDRNNGKDPVKYRLSVIMTRENDNWYVDPRSLKTYEAVEPTIDPATITAAPTLEPPASASTILYYNPDGGTKYHLDQFCISTHSKYLPLKGQFTYGQVNDEPYSSMDPCNVCAAPLR